MTSAQARLILDVLDRHVPVGARDRSRAVQAITELDKARETLAAVRQLVGEQAEDEGLWGIHPSGEQPIVTAAAAGESDL